MLLVSLLALSTNAHATTCWSGKHIEKGTLTCYTSAGDTPVDSVVVTRYSEGLSDEIAMAFSGWTADFTLQGGARLDPGSSGTLTLMDESRATLTSYTVTVDDGGMMLVGPADCGCTTRGCVCEAPLELESITVRETGDGLSMRITGVGARRVHHASVLTATYDDAVTECIPNSRICTTYPGTTREQSWSSSNRVLRGRWDGEYSDGSSPGTWSGSRATNIRVDTFDAAGDRLDRERFALAGAADDGADGRPALPLEQDDLTRLTLLPAADAGEDGVLAVVSDGWSRDDAPREALVLWEDGDDWSIPLNSAQVSTWVDLDLTDTSGTDDFTLVINGRRLPVGISTGGPGVCRYGACYCVSQTSRGTWGVSITAYANSASALPESLTVEVLGADGAVATTQRSYTAVFGDEVSVVFASALELAGDPNGVEVGGELALRGVGPGRSGMRTLSSGRFEGELFLTTDGSPALSAAALDGGVQGRGDILIGGEPIDIEREGAPPAVIFVNDLGEAALVTFEAGTR